MQHFIKEIRMKYAYKKMILTTIIAVFTTYPTLLFATNPVDYIPEHIILGFEVADLLHGSIHQDAPQSDATEDLRTSATTINTIIRNRISTLIYRYPSFFSIHVPTSATNYDPMTGLSAGDDFQKYGLWSNLSFVSTENDKTETKFDSMLGLGILGVDYRLSPNLITGICVSYEDNDRDTLYNYGHIDKNGFTMSPYLAYIVNDIISIDAVASYSLLSIDQDGFNNNIVDSFDSERWSISAGIHGFYTINEKTNTLISVSYIFSNEDQDDNLFPDIETTELGTILLDAELDYRMSNNFETYMTFGYHYDTQYEEPIELSYDEEAFTLGVGLRLLAYNKYLFDFYFDTELGRDDQEQFSGMLNIRYEF